MRALLLSTIFLCAPVAIKSQTLSDPDEVLLRARDKIIDRTERLPNYTCVQTVDRKYFKVKKPQFPVLSCDDMSARKSKKTSLLKLEATERLRLDVKVSGGTEIGAWAGASHFQDGNVMKLIKGPFGTGGFGTFLTDIFTGVSIPFYFEGEEPVNLIKMNSLKMDSLKLFRYRFEVTREASHYMVHAGGEWVYTGYDGDVWIDPQSSELRRLRVRTAELPEETNACESTTNVEYATMHIGTGDFLLPERSTLHFLMRDMGESDVATTYSGCHQYHAESNLVTDPSEAAGESKAAPAPISIPAGLGVKLTLAQPIDTDHAAAGDVVVATVSEAVRDPNSGEVVIPNGSTVRGRIVIMQHLLGTPRSFTIAIQLETVEIKGVSSPLYAMRPLDSEPWTTRGTLEKRERTRPIFLPPPGQSRRVSNFSFFTKANHYVMPRGYETKWITVAAPDLPRP